MMADMKELSAELARCGNALIALSVAMAGSKQEAVQPAETPTTSEPVPLEKVRSVLADKSRLGHTAEVKDLLRKHGAVKLSEVNPAEYPELLAEAEGLK